MSQPSNIPSLTPQFCFNQTALRDFLRLSRSTIDDSITQNLNALLTSTHPTFDPRSTSSRLSLSSNRTRTLIPATTCAHFRTAILFPSWQSRSDVLTYCADVAASADPDDPDLVLRQAESERDRERVVDERLDPYSGRFFPSQARTEALMDTVRNERAVEGIVRRRTWGVVTERCGGVEEGWEQALERWRDGEGKR